MRDDEFAAAMERCEIPNADFHHRDHLRLAWIYLRRYGADQAGARMAETIRRFAAHHGKAGRYHETITLAWMRLMASAGGSNFEEAVATKPELLDRGSLGAYYSPALLASDEARVRFVPPDLAPLP